MNNESLRIFHSLTHLPTNIQELILKATYDTVPAIAFTKSQFTEHEDEIIKATVEKSDDNPFTAWQSVTALLPGREGKKIRDRWVNYLYPALNHSPFGRDDVSILCSLVNLLFSCCPDPIFTAVDSGSSSKGGLRRSWVQMGGHK